MDTIQVKKEIYNECPELRNCPHLMNSLNTFLVEIDKIVMRLNENTKEKNIIVDIQFEYKKS